jgi:hypothetical protein
MPKSTDYDFDDDDQDPEDERKLPSSPRIITQRERIPHSHLNSLNENLSVVFTTIYRTIANNANLVTIANKRNAMDDNNPILAFKNIYDEYVQTTGISITVIFRKLLLLRQPKSTPVEDLITEIEKCRRDLAERNFPPDDILLCAVFLIAVYDHRLREKIDDKINSELDRSGSAPPWNKVAELARAYDKNKVSLENARRSDQPTSGNPYNGSKPNTPLHF